MARAIWSGSLSFGLVNIPSKCTRRSAITVRISNAARQGPLADQLRARVPEGRKTVAWEDL